MAIDTSQVRPKFTSSIIGNIVLGNAPTSALGGNFKPISKKTKYLEWNVQRWGETVATDVAIGSDPNLNTANNLTRKITELPYFYEEINVTQVTGYDRAFPDNGVLDRGAYADFRMTMATEIKNVCYKIDRAKEIYARDLFRTGIVTPRICPAVNYSRNALSMPGYDASWDWSIATVDPRVKIAAGCSFMRAYGQSDDAVFKIYCGDGAYQAFMINPFIKDALKFHENVLDAPQVRQADGSVYQRTVTCGQYRVEFYTYPQVYTPYGTADLTGASKVPYIADNEVFMAPKSMLANYGHALVPSLPSELKQATVGANMVGGNVGSIDGLYYIDDYVDIKHRAWMVTVEACPLPIVYAVDQMYNLLVLAP